METAQSQNKWNLSGPRNHVQDETENQIKKDKRCTYDAVQKLMSTRAHKQLWINSIKIQEVLERANMPTFPT
jgi:hypothetical protein